MKLMDYISVVNQTRYLTVAFPFHTMDDVPDFATMHAALIHDARKYSPLRMGHEKYQFSQLQNVAEEFGYRNKLHEHQEVHAFQPFWNPMGYWLHLMTELPKIHTLDILTEKMDDDMLDIMQSFFDFVHDSAHGPLIKVRLHEYPWNTEAWESDENHYHLLEHHDQRLMYTYHAPPNASIFLTAMAAEHHSPIAVAEHDAKNYWHWKFVQI